MTAAIGAVLTSPVEGLGWRSLGRGLPQSGQWRQGFDVADLNGDGELDILHGPARRGDGRPVIFLGDGNGAFSPWREARFPDLPFDYGDAVAADFSGDGHMDVAFGCHLRGLTVLKGDGQGSFDVWDEGLKLDTSGEAFSSRALGVVDWNGDGREDLVALGEGPSPGQGGSDSTASYGLRVLLNKGDGSWDVLEATEPGRLFGYSLAIGDLDGDGQPKVVVSSRSQGQLEVIHSALPDGSIARRHLGGARSRSILHAVTMHDFDRDGTDDVAASFVVKSSRGDWVGGIDIYPSKEAGHGQRLEILLLQEPVEISVVAAGDLDADGLPDLVVGGAAGRLWVFRGKRNGGLKKIGSASIERAAKGCKAAHARLIDIDGEPGDELVIAFSGEPDGEEICPTGGSIQVWKAK